MKYICVDVSGALLLLLVGFCLGHWAFCTCIGSFVVARRSCIYPVGSLQVPFP
jgi:hypothetical protein